MKGRLGGSLKDPTRNILLSLISLGLFLSLAEGVARLVAPPPDVAVHREHELLITMLGLPAMNEIMEYDPLLFWRLKAGLRGVLVEGVIRRGRVYPMRFTVSTNSQGLRGGEITPGKKGVRILAIGDSTTFGLGVEGDETWPALLERRLEAAIGERTQVINAGVPGYSSYQGLRYLQEHGLSLKPDLVVATFGLNDSDSWSSRSDYQTARALAIQRWERPFLGSRLYTSLKRVVRREASVTAGASGEPRLSPAELYRTLDELRETCSSRGIPLVLLVWPLRGQQEIRDSALVGFQPVIVSLAAARGVPVVNLVESFARGQGELFLDHVHASGGGLRLVAETIAPICLETLSGVPGL